jgi:hypothetical protein
MPRDASPIPAPVGLRPERHRTAPAAPTLAAAAPGTLPPAASESWPRVARRELLVALAPCLVLAAGISLAWPATVDDAFISLRHARILVAHGELSFNADERVEGYSNFSEVLLAAALLDRGIEPLGVIKALCSVAALACVPLLYLLSRRLGATHAFALLGALLLALSTGLAFWSASGLEIPGCASSGSCTAFTSCGASSISATCFRTPSTSSRPPAGKGSGSPTP